MKLTIELPDRFALKALGVLGNEKTGPYIANGCRCPGCVILRKVRAQIRRQVDPR
jgi:hypothetical protein